MSSMKKILFLLFVMCSYCSAQVKFEMGGKQFEVKGEKTGFYPAILYDVSYYLEITRDSLFYHELTANKGETDTYVSYLGYRVAKKNIDLKKDFPNVYLSPYAEKGVTLYHQDIWMKNGKKYFSFVHFNDQASSSGMSASRISLTFNTTEKGNEICHKIKGKK
jgi:hypothetical protein